MKRQLSHFEPDPALESLLDEALAPEQAPAGLVQRTLATTQPMLRRRRQVVAWLGPIRAAAAVILLVAGFNVIAISHGIINDARDRVSTTRELAEFAAAANAYQAPSAPIDNEIQLLALQIEFLKASDLMDPQWHHMDLTMDEAEVLNHVEALF